MTKTSTGENPQVSYRTLRRVVGVLGVALPVLLALLGFILLRSLELLDSISHYYSLRTRDVLVGTLLVIGFFLFAYEGPDGEDNAFGNFACVFALGVAFFPNSGELWERVVHFVSAAALFLLLAYFSICLFTKSGESLTPQKKIRNRVYVICGWTIVACIALIGLYHLLLFFGLLLDDGPISRLRPVFWLESLALWAFGTSWFIKGETLLKDKPV